MSTQSATLKLCSPLTNEHANRNTGWLLLLGALASSTWLAPWSLGDGSGAVAANNGTTTALQAQTMIVVLGILQLATFHLLRTLAIDPARRNIAGWLTVLGSLLAALGYALTARLVIVGALIMSAGYIVLMSSLSFRQGDRETTISLAMICFGMLLIAALALYDGQVTHIPIVDLGPNDGFTLRTLRLARIAAVVLPVLSFLYEGLLSRDKPRDRIARFGRRAMLCGVVGMASILAASGLILVHFKTLLVIPSLAIFAGVACGLCLARRHAAPLEIWGWLLIALSLAGGLLMGLYAFADPWIKIHFLGDYNDHARRLIRLAHVDGVVLGLAAIFLSREIDLPGDRRLHDFTEPLLVAGSILAVATPLLLALVNLSIAILSVGPAFVIAAILFCVASKNRPRR